LGSFVYTASFAFSASISAIWLTAAIHTERRGKKQTKAANRAFGCCAGHASPVSVTLRRSRLPKPLTKLARARTAHITAVLLT
jgi:hypothetical protein